MGYGSNKAIVGLDIEPGYVAAVEAAPGSVAVDRAAYAPLAPGVVRDGEVVDVDTLAGVLREMFAEHKLGKRVRLGVANQRIVMRTIDLPPLTDDKQIASAIRFQAQEHIPMPLDQAVLEHQPLGTVETEDGPRTRVVLVAARRDMIDRMVEAATRAGLRPQGIDLSAFAMIRALHRADVTGTAVYVNVGGITNLAIANGTVCVFTRVVPFGIESLAAELAERRALTLEHSHGWLSMSASSPLSRTSKVTARSSQRPGASSLRESVASVMRSATRLTSTSCRRARRPLSAWSSRARPLRSQASLSRWVSKLACRSRWVLSPREGPAGSAALTLGALRLLQASRSTRSRREGHQPDPE